MSAATITQAQGKGSLRQFFAQTANAVRDFSVAMYAARDREFTARESNLFAAPAATTREQQQGRMQLLSLAAQSEAHSPSLAAELRHIAGRG